MASCLLPLLSDIIQALLYVTLFIIIVLEVYEVVANAIVSSSALELFLFGHLPILRFLLRAFHVLPSRTITVIYI